MADKVRLTERQTEMLKQAASAHGARVYTRYDAAVMERLFIKDLTIRTCNGTDAWFATRAGRAHLASSGKTGE
jgi:hypothetical protein